MARLPDPELQERRRRQILDAALTCFRRRGFHQARMQEICAEAKLSAGAVYRYFRSKTDIIVAIAEDEHADVAVRFAAEAASGPTFPLVLKLCEAALSKAESIGGTLIADVLAEASRNPDLARRIAETERRHRPLIEQALRRGVERGELAAIDPTAAARVIETYLDGFVIGAVIPGFRDATEARADLLLFLTRLLSPTEGARPMARSERRVEEV